MNRASSVPKTSLVAAVAIAAAALLALAAPASAAGDTGSFLVRLGRDTTGVEHYTRTPDRLEIDQIGRAPRVLRRHLVYEYKDGSVTHFSMIVGPPGANAPTQTIDGVVGPDSLRIQTKTGANPIATSSIVLPPGTVVLALSSPWSCYEAPIMRLVKSKSDSLRTPLFLLGASNVGWLSLHKLGRDSVSIFNDHEDQYHVRVDKTGRILGVAPIAGTAQVNVERIPALDLDATATAWAAREKEGQGIGVLSPRDTVRVADAGGASLWIDYGRPGKRGRTIFGVVVPYGEIWRTGANAATQFRTDKALDFGGTVIQPGTYTLWTIPSAAGWKLVVNSETGQWGTAHRAEKDIATIDMKVVALPEAVERFTISVDPTPQGGVLNLDWDTTRASAPFTVRP